MTILRSAQCRWVAFGRDRRRSAGAGAPAFARRRRRRSPGFSRLSASIRNAPAAATSRRARGPPAPESGRRAGPEDDLPALEDARLGLDIDDLAVPVSMTADSGTLRPHPAAERQSGQVFAGSAFSFGGQACSRSRLFRLRPRPRGVAHRAQLRPGDRAVLLLLDGQVQSSGPNVRRLGRGSRARKAGSRRPAS